MKISMIMNTVKGALAGGKSWCLASASHMVIAGLVTATVVGGGVTTGVLVHNHNVEVAQKQSVVDRFGKNFHPSNQKELDKETGELLAETNKENEKFEKEMADKAKAENKTVEEVKLEHEADMSNRSVEQVKVERKARAEGKSEKEIKELVKKVAVKKSEVKTGASNPSQAKKTIKPSAPVHHDTVKPVAPVHHNVAPAPKKPVAPVHHNVAPAPKKPSYAKLVPLSGNPRQFGLGSGTNLGEHNKVTSRLHSTYSGLKGEALKAANCLADGGSESKIRSHFINKEYNGYLITGVSFGTYSCNSDIPGTMDTRPWDDMFKDWCNQGLNRYPGGLYTVAGSVRQNAMGKVGWLYCKKIVINVRKL